MTKFKPNEKEILKIIATTDTTNKPCSVDLISEENEKVVFLRKIIKGSTDKSYGIYVARLAGMPNEIVKRATVILNEFEKINVREKQIKKQKTDNSEYQIPMDTFSEAIAQEIKNLDVNTLTPIDALNKLHDLINKFNVNNK